MNNINIKNMSGVSRQYVRDERKFIDAIVQGCAEVDERERVQREKEQKQEQRRKGNNMLVAEMARDMKEMEKKYFREDTSTEDFTEDAKDDID